MTIDPMAAVNTAAGGAGSLAAGADPAASADVTQTTQSNTQLQSPGVQSANQAERMDLFDYTTEQQKPKPPAIDTLQPESKAKYMSNPAALGEKVLQRMEGLHQRSMDYREQMDANRSSAAGAAGGGEPTMAGPASDHVAGTATSQPGNFSSLQLTFDYAIETTMISNSSSQFTTSVNTLMRGQ